MLYHTILAASGAQSVTTSHASAYGSSQRASSVHGNRHAASAKQSSSPLQFVPTAGTRLESQRKWLSPTGRTLPVRLMRKNGCHFRPTICSYNHLAYKPRSANTITIQSGGTALAKWVKRSFQYGSHEPGSLLRTIFQATGIAQPR